MKKTRIAVATWSVMWSMWRTTSNLSKMNRTATSTG